jgi:hypothetical protein
MAAQRQSRTAVKVIRPFGRTDDTRIEATLGLDRSLARWRSEGDPDAATEVGFEAAVFARFDLHEEYDMEATDWRFGIPLVRRDGDLAWKVHLSHRTSHLGDEYMERTGATPVHYHMEEAAAGVSWDASAGSRVYGEAGAALYTGGPAANGRVQSGYEWVGSKGGLGLSPWVAMDLEARNEQDWNPNATLAAGVALGRSARLGFEYYRGRDPQTQFLEDRMQWVALALTFDY